MPSKNLVISYLLLLSILSLLMLALGCTSPSHISYPQGQDDVVIRADRTSPSHISYPQGQDDVVIRADRTEGGPLPPLFLPEYTRPPWFTLYGDGTVIYLQGDVDAKLLKGKLSEQVIQELLEFIVTENRYFESKAWYSYPVMDAPADILRVNAQGRSRVVMGYLWGDTDTMPKNYTTKDWEQYCRLTAIIDKLRHMNPQVIDSPDYQYLGEYKADTVTLYTYMLEPDMEPIESLPWLLEDIDLASISSSPYALGKRILTGEMAYAIQENVKSIYGFSYSCKDSKFRVSYLPHLPGAVHEWIGYPDFPLCPTPHILYVDPHHGAAVEPAKTVTKGLCIRFDFQQGYGMGPEPKRLIRIFLDDEDVTDNVSWIVNKEADTPVMGQCCYKPEHSLESGCHILRITYRDIADELYEFIEEFFVN
jgi:hypothetical protein